MVRNPESRDGYQEISGNLWERSFQARLTSRSDGPKVEDKFRCECRNPESLVRLLLDCIFRPLSREGGPKVRLQ